MSRLTKEVAFGLIYILVGLISFAFVARLDSESYVPSPCEAAVDDRPESVTIDFFVACLHSVRHEKSDPLLKVLRETTGMMEQERDAASDLAKAQGSSTMGPATRWDAAYRLWRWQRELSESDSEVLTGLPDVDDLVSLCGSKRGCSGATEAMKRFFALMDADVRKLRGMVRRYRALRFRPDVSHDAEFRSLYLSLSRHARRDLLRSASGVLYLGPQPATVGDWHARSPLAGQLERRAASVDFPATALILRQTGLDGKTFQQPAVADLEPWCTGTLIADHWRAVSNVVLTAAHCVCGVKTRESDEHVNSESCLDIQKKGRLGGPPHRALDPRNYVIFFQGVGLHAIKGFEINPQYISYRTFPSGANRTGADLAVIYLTEPVRTIKPAAVMPKDNAILNDDIAFLVGFGQHPRLDSSASPNEQMGAGAKIHALAAILPFDKNLLARTTNPLSNAMGADIGIFGNICPGDSGGPLYWTPWREQPVLDNKFEIAGVTSFAWDRRCMTANNTFWTDLRRHRDWLEPLVPKRPKQDADADLRLEPILNADDEFLVQKPDGVLFKNGAKTLTLAFTVPDGESGKTVTVTANATCTAVDTRICAATALAMTVQGPIGASTRCTATAHSTVLECRLALVGGQWSVVVEGYLRPIRGIELTAAQDVQIVGRYTGSTIVWSGPSGSNE